MMRCTRRGKMLDFTIFNDTAATEIYTLSLHDALPIWGHVEQQDVLDLALEHAGLQRGTHGDDLVRVDALVRVATGEDRKSTRLNSSHANISYAVFCLKKQFQPRLYLFHLLPCVHYTLP